MPLWLLWHKTKPKASQPSLPAMVAVPDGELLPAPKMPLSKPRSHRALGSRCPRTPPRRGPLFCCPAELTPARTVAVPGDGEVPRAGPVTSVTSITLPRALQCLP